MMVYELIHLTSTANAWTSVLETHLTLTILANCCTVPPSLPVPATALPLPPPPPTPALAFDPSARTATCPFPVLESVTTTHPQPKDRKASNEVKNGEYEWLYLDDPSDVTTVGVERG